MSERMSESYVVMAQSAIPDPDRTSDVMYSTFN